MDGCGGRAGGAGSRGLGRLRPEAGRKGKLGLSTQRIFDACSQSTGQLADRGVGSKHRKL